MIQPWNQNRRPRITQGSALAVHSTRRFWKYRSNISGNTGATFLETQERLFYNTYYTYYTYYMYFSYYIYDSQSAKERENGIYVWALSASE